MPPLALLLLLLVHGDTKTVQQDKLAGVRTVDVQAVEGMVAQFPCDLGTAANDKVYMVFWFRDDAGIPLYSFDVRGKPLSEARHWSAPEVFGPRAHFATSPPPAALLVRDVKRRDEGVYRCRVDFRNTQTTSFRYNLTVVVPPEKPVVVDRWGRVINTTTLGPHQEGDDVMLTCRVLGGRPEPTVRWLVNGVLVDAEYEQNTGDVIENRLMWPAIRRADYAAVFTCQAANSQLIPPREVSLVLDMFLRPLTVEIRRPAEIGEGGSLTAERRYEVSCESAGSRPPAVITWHKGKRLLKRITLYEISDDPQRKEFLDDLFSFMQKRGTPINRLPIMAKSVLDLYELYNLVIARGGLVEVINKKLWQEIIKGLRLPSSITSAAFTLRTQYMKYLYDYECEKKNLSTRSELDAAIEGNKREGRRASGQYDAQAALAMPPLNRVPASLAQLSQHMQPLSLSLGGGVPRLPPLPPHAPHLSQHDIEYRVREYMKMIQTQRELMRNGSESPPGSGPTPMMSPRDAAALSAIDVSRLTLWSLYNNNNNSPQPDLEPQREALNLSESPNSSLTGIKREACRSPPPPAKRRTPRPPSPRAPSPPRAGALPDPLHGNGVNGAAFKITTRGDASTGDQQLVVSIELNGVTYEGVLFPSQNASGQNGHRQMVS